ncbi:hydrogenase maturation protease [Bacillus tianshenii]|uniref:Hydrogenase maturation protease n=1 Tax=Sutcliffiella tianshenii TaxID=1463404 RepID=A0ABS2P2T4_9BACI|nr:hydrogenase maturation protease [Bacillus tianshenii]MBM7621240.1 hydrogenase maturation protease [Bacillus tianshenii]
MEKIIVLGIGNLLMMDDGIGIYLVQELAEKEQGSPIEYIVGESDIDYCLEQLEGASFVIIIDAVRSGKDPGEITVYSLGNLHENNTLDISPHNLHLFQMLYHQREEIKGYLIGIEPYEIQFQIGLSENLEIKRNKIFQKVRDSINALVYKI